MTTWTSKADLIDVVVASCNWPFFFSQWPFVNCRGSWALDGFFAVEPGRMGCPPVDAERTLAVTALPKVPMDAFGTVIQPDLFDDPRMPVDDGTWISWALKPAEDADLEAMATLGRAHARRWHDRREPETVGDN